MRKIDCDCQTRLYQEYLKRQLYSENYNLERFAADLGFTAKRLNQILLNQDYLTPTETSRLLVNLGWIGPDIQSNITATISSSDKNESSELIKESSFLNPITLNNFDLSQSNAIDNGPIDNWVLWPF